MIWIFATLDVASRLWPSTVVGRRSYRKHPRTSQKHLSQDAPRRLSSDRDERIRLLRERCPSPLRHRLCLRPGSEDSSERSRASGRQVTDHRCAVGVRRSARRVRRLVHARQVLHREIEADDSPGNCVPEATLGLPRTLTEETRGTDRNPSLPLPSRPPPPSFEVRF